MLQKENDLLLGDIHIVPLLIVYLPHHFGEIHCRVFQWFNNRDNALSSFLFVKNKNYEANQADIIGPLQTGIAKKYPHWRRVIRDVAILIFVPKQGFCFWEI